MKKLQTTSTGPIADNCWKIYPVGAKQLITYAGAENTGDAIVDVLHNGYFGENYQEQFKSAVNSVKPMSDQSAVDMIMATSSNDEVILTYYDYDSDKFIDIPNGSWVIIGSVPKSSKDALNKLIDKTLKILPQEAHPEHFLTVLLGLLMADARYFNLAKYGIGGAFCGAYLTPQVRGWQPDILFHPFKKVDNRSELDGFPLQTLVRDNNFVVGTSAQGMTIRAWQNDNWDKEWLDYLTNYPDFGRTDYIVFYSTDSDVHRTVIIEMRKHKTSLHAKLEAHGKQMRLIWKNLVEQNLISKQHGFAYIPFETDLNTEKKYWRLYCKCFVRLYATSTS